MKLMKSFFCGIGFVLCSTVVNAEWLDLTNSTGTPLVAKIVSKTDFKVTLVRRSDHRKFTIDRKTLSIDSQEIVENWVSDAGTSDSEPLDLGPFSKRLYPNSLEEIESTIAEIQARESDDKDITAEQQRTINELNVYRFLCGAPYDVEADPELVEAATDAALACERNGSLSHDLGHSTGKCNLTTRGSMFESVAGYINDSGANNRVHRGHRLWCLNPPMTKTGFGTGKNGFSAMYAFDEKGKKSKSNWSYPGHGLFPHKYLHGNGWTLYLTEAAPEKDKLTVEVYKIDRRPEKAFLRKDFIEGKKLPVEWISTERTAINFEPESGTVDKGIYWVRVYGGGVSEGYLVELY